LITTYDQAVDYLDGHIGLGVHPGLERITDLLEMMGDPQDGYPIIHIAGTNGKTSASRMATLLCIAHGLTTGTFTSPHLEKIEERLSVNAQMATREQFTQAVSDVVAFADIYEQRNGQSLTYFELTAAMAFAWFADQAVNAAVIEVGLGGRLDATNACHGDVSVLTGVGLDHIEYLGETVEEIAGEKLGIVEESSNLVVGPVIPEIAKLARRKAAEKGARIFEYGKDYRVEDAVRAVGGWLLDISGIHGSYGDLYLPIHGRHQTINLAVAMASVEALFGRELSHDAVADAVSLIRSPGRMEPVGSSPLILLDGAHNPDGFSALAASLGEEFPTTTWVLILGVMEDKDLEHMVPSVAPHLKSVITTSVESSRASDPDELARRVRDLTGLEVVAIADQQEALDRARGLATEDDGVLVAGSLYLVGAVRALLRQTDEISNGF